MSENRTVREIVVRGKPEGLDALKQKLDGVAASQAGLAKASDTTGAATEQLSRRQLWPARRLIGCSVRSIPLTARTGS